MKQKKIEAYNGKHMPESVIIASDHAGFELKEQLKNVLHEQGFAVEDIGTHSLDSVDYPDFGYAIANALINNPTKRGIAICGSGIGISMAANRHAAVRCALCHDGLSAELARRHNDANVLALGARLIGIEYAKDAVLRFLNTEFDGGRHQKRVEKLSNPPTT